MGYEKVAESLYSHEILPLDLAVISTSPLILAMLMLYYAGASY